MELHPGHSVTGPPPRRGAAHAVRPPVPVARVIGVLLGVIALIVGAGIVASACLSSLGPSTSTPTSARSITVTPLPSP